MNCFPPCSWANRRQPRQRDPLNRWLRYIGCSVNQSMFLNILCVFIQESQHWGYGHRSVVHIGLPSRAMSRRFPCNAYIKSKLRIEASQLLWAQSGIEDPALPMKPSADWVDKWWPFLFALVFINTYPISWFTINCVLDYQQVSPTRLLQGSITSLSAIGIWRSGPTIEAECKLGW